MERPYEQNGTTDGKNGRDCRVPVIMQVPPAGFVMLYDDEVGFGRGTIFRQLDKPFFGRFADKSRCNCDYAGQMYERHNMPDREMTEDENR